MINFKVDCKLRIFFVLIFNNKFFLKLFKNNKEEPKLSFRFNQSIFDLKPWHNEESMLSFDTKELK